MDAISGSREPRQRPVESGDASRASGAADARMPSTCPHASSGAVAGAAGGGALASAGTDLRATIDRLAVAVEQLRMAVESFARRVAGGGGVAGGAGGGVAPQQAPQQSPIQGGGPISTQATSRSSVLPELRPGQVDQLRMARNQVTYRQVVVDGGTSGTTIQPPQAAGGVTTELFVLRDFQRGAHRTQVLEPVRGPVTIAAGDTARVVARVTATTPGDHVVDIAGARLQVHVGTRSIDALPMMAWINESNAKQRGADPAALGSVLAHFGVAASGNSGITTTSASNRSPVQYFSAAYEAATRASPADTARRIIEAERRAGSANPNATFWVQVSDEQDKSADQAQGTTAWIAELRSHLQAGGSRAKLFVAAQARPHNLVYASVIDGWATTQSAAGRDRDTAIRDIRAASSSYGRSLELLEYPGNAFFDAGTPGSAAISTATAALDGAGGWFIYSANNHDVLERGGGDEGRGDIGGLVAIDGGRVLPTIALIEAEFGANLGAAARAFGASNTSGAAQVAAYGDQLDAYRHTTTPPDLRAWEAQIGRLVD